MMRVNNLRLTMKERIKSHNGAFRKTILTIDGVETMKIHPQTKKQDIENNMFEKKDSMLKQYTLV